MKNLYPIPLLLFLLNLFVNFGCNNVSSPSATADSEPTNSAPNGTDHTVIINYNRPTPFSLNGSDSDGDSLTFTILTNPSHGALSGTAPDLIYTPNNDYSGTDSFTFKLNDGALDSSPIIVNLTISQPMVWYVSDETLDRSWSEPSNWWRDTSSTIPASRIPQDGDFVILKGNFSPSSGPTSPILLGGFDSSALLAQVDGGWNGLVTSFITIEYRGRLNLGIEGDDNWSYLHQFYGSTIDNSVSVTFQGSSVNLGTINGNATFKGYSSNMAIVTGNGTFSEFASNGWEVRGDATFLNNAKNGDSNFLYGGVVFGNAEFFGSSINSSGVGDLGLIKGNATFNDTSSNGGRVDGVCYGNDGQLDGIGCEGFVFP